MALLRNGVTVAREPLTLECFIFSLGPLISFPLDYLIFFPVLSQSCNLAHDGISPPADHEDVIERSLGVSIISLMEGCVGWGDDVNIFLVLQKGPETRISPITPHHHHHTHIHTHTHRPVSLSR